MNIRHIMSAPAVTVPPLTPVAAVARHMDHSGVGCVLVVDEGRLIGIITDRDLALRVVARERPYDVPVSQAMTVRPVTIAPDAELEDAFRIFRRGQFRRLPVVDGTDVIGIVTVDDLLLHSHQREGDLLRPVASEILEPQHQPV